MTDGENSISGSGLETWSLSSHRSSGIEPDKLVEAQEGRFLPGCRHLGGGSRSRAPTCEREGVGARGSCS